MLRIKTTLVFLLIGLILSTVGFPRYSSQIIQASGSTNNNSVKAKYPFQEVHIVSSTDGNLAIQEGQLQTGSDTVKSNERWRLSTTDGTYFQIINMENELLLTANNNETHDIYYTEASDAYADQQLWSIVGQDKDSYGDFYNYIIANKDNPSLVLTEENNQIKISPDQEMPNQKWKLNSSGIVGYAGFVNDKDNNIIKTATTGGLLGVTVEVRDYESFKRALDDDVPKTIIVAADIDMGVEPVVTKIGSNKTIIGSYHANTLTNPRFFTDDPYGVSKVSNNIIIKNLNINVDNRPGLITLSVYGTRNLWVDHSSFDSNMPVDVNEVGKYIWINYSGNQDLDPDYYTISYSKFSNRYWAVTFGANSITQNHGTVAYNFFDACVRRTPETGNGRLHALNNYIQRDSNDVDNPYAAILGAYEAHTYSEGNRFEGFHQLKSGYWDFELGSTYVKDVGSYTNSGVNPTLIPHLLKTQEVDAMTTYDPNEHYKYKVLKAYDENNGYDVKKFTSEYSGIVASSDKLKYVDFPEFSEYLLSE
ncbi:pectate lyase [Paenibacillus amylolyticus]|nr:pectate lyase-like adhesive domain-containing protein [Paenibacillus amylolyticus]WFR60902.1 pectate lyase [Paenibacillus amylolyticus]